MKTAESIPSNNPWVIVIGICAILIVSFAAYSAISNSKNQECRAKATVSLMWAEILDTKWTMAGCEYLVREKYGDTTAEWVPQFILDTRVNSERNATK